MKRISSRDNQILKLARKVRDGNHRELVFLEGKRLVKDAIQSGILIRSIIFFEELPAEEIRPFIESRIEDRNGVYSVSRKLFDGIAETKNPQGVIALAERPKWSLDRIKLRLEDSGIVVKIILYLSQINNPSNLGAAIRAAEAAGIAGVITSPGSADPFSAKSIRGSMGSVFRVPIVENMDPKILFDLAAEYQLQMVGLDPRGDISIYEYDWTQPVILVVGSEAHGIAENELSQAVKGLVIPMESTVESLNLAVSVGITLFEAKRRVT
ncbi:TrmH family RNA methyltransferase [Leptolyngbya sp. 7M]|uniref:TrmH family RNA methyltransferase n=1 Tax=Leptolyngbya sp. 7M TaxID=2812896 RepID=UPI001B8D870E|nr:RNA methyltransferase [Leptolyngbya sp. 7M]QYO66627.1 RNA methyltransferase [Leptolyngbya sp. 7M]